MYSVMVICSNPDLTQIGSKMPTGEEAYPGTKCTQRQNADDEMPHTRVVKTIIITETIADRCFLFRASLRGSQ